MKQICALLIAILLAACARSQTGAGDDWTNPGGDQGKTHFSRLDDINSENVTRLGFAWELRLDTTRGMEATPVVIDGVMVTSGVAGRVYALNAATGEEHWRFEPEIDPRVHRGTCCDMVNRGVAVKDGRVFVGALDGVLYALDLRTGRVLWRVDTIVDRNRAYSITGAPEVAGDVVIIGNGGAEFDVRGYVTAYDVRTGRERWRFYTVPRDPAQGPQESPDLEAALETWDPESRWDIGGGGTAWDTIHYDPEFNAVYVGVGNGGPYHVARRSPSGGENLYLCSIVALDPRTGRVKWHYQETPGDSWDYTATQPMVLTRLDINGESTPVLLHAPKNGFLYVIDRRNGRVIAANALVYMNWASGVDLATGRPNLTPETSNYALRPQIVFPTAAGARNWHPMAFSPETGLLYASVLDMGNLLFMSPGAKPHRVRALNNDAAIVFAGDILDVLPSLPPPVRAAVEASPELARVRNRPASQELRAIDPLTGRTVWSVPRAAWQDRAGVLATAGDLVFQGDLMGRLNAYDARDGRRLHTIETGTSILAAPMTYRVDGVQYVAVMAGWGGGGWSYVPRQSAAYERGNQNRILAFRLDGGATPVPDPLPPLEPAPAPPPQLAGTTPARIERGRDLFFGNCGICHSNQARSLLPDLRRMQRPTHDLFQEIVREGLYEANGMPGWSDLLSREDVDAIHAFLIEEQRRTRARELDLQRRGQPLDPPRATITSSN
ncbi:MAG: PQQ-dependent dehydrogenase, methanol/ethanol family [Hydrogenophilaceae bacterium]|nr:PQQ-dependent dehydrogenase, methanol/ethanol family [Hydrogenophilaceae bacterium]